jgi:WD40 repeat protein
MQNHRRWLEIVEYLSIAGSIVGSVVAVAYQQILYAATPLSLSLLLNLVNRRRVDAPGASAKIVQINRQVSRDIELLRQELSGLPNQVEVSNLQRGLGQLSQMMAQIQSEVVIQRQEINATNSNFQVLIEQLSSIKNPVSTSEPDISNSSAIRIFSAEVKQQIEALKAGLASVAASNESSELLSQALVSNVDLERFFAELEKVDSKQESLRASLTSIERALTRLEQPSIPTAALENAEILSEELNQVVEIYQTISNQQLEILSGAFAQMQQELHQLSLALKSPENDPIGDRLDRLSVELGMMPAQISSRLEHLDPLNIKSLQEVLENLQVQYEYLQESIDSLAEWLRGEAASPVREQKSLQAQTSSAPAETGTYEVIELQPSGTEPEQTSATILSQESENEPETVSVNEPISETIDLEKITLENLVTEVEFSEDQEFIEPESFEPFQEWRCTNILLGHSSAVTCLAISPSSKVLATGSYKEIKIWNLETGIQLQTLSGDADAMAVSDLAISADGETIVCANAGIEIWNLRTGTRRQVLETTYWASSVAISGDGKILMSGEEDPVDEIGSIQTWNLETGTLLKEFGSNVIYSVVISTNQTFFVAAGYGQIYENSEATHLMQVQNLETGDVIQTIPEPAAKITKIALSPDDQTLVSAHEDGTIKVWNVKTGELLNTLSEHSLPVHTIAISPDGSLIASGSSDKTVKIWDLNTGELLQTLSEHSEKVCAVAFSPDGKILVSSSSDMSVKIYRT